jgi:phosphoglycolate phosphatase
LALGDRYLSILFDLDGTLADSRVGITKSVQYALRKQGVVIDNPDDLVPYIGPPLEWAFREFHGLSEAQARRALQSYREYYESTGIFQHVAYPRIEDLLGSLSRKGKQLFVVTSKPGVYADQILSYFRLDRYFHAIEGSEMDGTRTDKAELIGYVLSKHALKKHQTVMVGDRLHDVVGAGTNGVDSIGVGYGFGSREELTNARATYFIESMEGMFQFFSS